MRLSRLVRMLLPIIAGDHWEPLAASILQLLSQTELNLTRDIDLVSCDVGRLLEACATIYFEVWNPQQRSRSEGSDVVRPRKAFRFDSNSSAVCSSVLNYSGDESVQATASPLLSAGWRDTASLLINLHDTAVSHLAGDAGTAKEALQSYKVQREFYDSDVQHLESLWLPTALHITETRTAQDDVLARYSLFRREEVTYVCCDGDNAGKILVLDSIVRTLAVLPSSRCLWLNATSPSAALGETTETHLSTSREQQIAKAAQSAWTSIISRLESPPSCGPLSRVLVTSFELKTETKVFGSGHLPTKQLGDAVHEVIRQLLPSTLPLTTVVLDCTSAELERRDGKIQLLEAADFLNGLKWLAHQFHFAICVSLSSASAAPCSHPTETPPSLEDCRFAGLATKLGCVRV